MIGTTKDEWTVLNTRLMLALSTYSYTQFINRTFGKEYLDEIRNVYQDLVYRNGTWFANSRIVSDYVYTCPSRFIASILATKNIPVFTYYVEAIVQSNRYTPFQVFHGSDLWYWFQTVHVFPSTTVDQYDILLSNQTIDYISSFVYHIDQKPLTSKASVTLWKPNEIFTFQTENFGGSYVTKFQESKYCQLWDKIYLNEKKI